MDRYVAHEDARRLDARMHLLEGLAAPGGATVRVRMQLGVGRHFCGDN